MEEDIFIYPSHEIHISRNTIGTKEVIIQVNHKDFIVNPQPNSVDYTITDVTNAAVINVVPGGSAAVCEYIPATKALRVLATGTTGQDSLTISFHNANHGVTLSKTVKVFVHERLDDWWLGNNSLSIPKDTRVFHCQVTVFGHFDAPDGNSVGTIADISGHSFINLVSSNTNCVLDGDNRGKVRGVTFGTGQLTASFLGKTEMLPVTIVNFYGDPTDARDPGTVTTPNTILERVATNAAEFKKSKDKFSYPTGIADRFNLLFLADGFKSSEQAVFDTAVNHVVQQMFSAEIHQPFKMCSGNFNVWKAFIPSAESSMTNARKKSIPGHAGSDGFEQVIDNHYGLYEPRRTADILYSANDMFMSGDPRRYPPELNWAKCIGRHIASLADSTGVRGSIWYDDQPVSPSGADFLKDFGLVVIFYNVSKIYTALTKGNANYGPFILMPLPREVYTPEPGLDRGTTSHQWKLNPKFPPVPANPKKAFADINFTTFVFIHELTHSFDIGDEYESPGGNYSNHIAGHSNINSFNEVRDGNSSTDIVSTGIKWFAYDRMEKSERILSINSLAAQANGKLRIEVTLATANIMRWEKDKKNGTKLYLREFRVRSHPSFSSFGGLTFIGKHFYRIPKYAEQMPPATPPNVTQEPALVVIKEIEIISLLGNDKMELDIDPARLPAAISGAADKLSALRTLITANGYVNGVLYKPKKTTASNADEKLVRADVAAYIDTNKIPLDRNGSSSPRGGEFPPNVLVKPRGRLRGNKFPFKVIGLYEGGDHANTNAFRPAGDCRMRNSYEGATSTPELCHVCQYYIVSLLNPAMLELVENNYPDFS